MSDLPEHFLADLRQCALDQGNGHGRDDGAGLSLVEVGDDVVGGDDIEVHPAVPPLHLQRATELRHESPRDDMYMVYSDDMPAVNGMWYLRVWRMIHISTVCGVW